MQAELREEHRMLARLVGDWTFEMEATMGADGPTERHTGSFIARSIGGAWILGEGRDATLSDPDTSVITLGYDPARQRYVGTFVASMLTHLWIYEGQADAAGTTITLDTEGPSFSGDGRMARYQDIVEIRDDDHWVLSSAVLGDDGTWRRFMTTHYRRI